MRKNIKKLAAVGLTAVLGAGLLAGCGGDGKSSGGKTEITFGIWDENQRPAMEQMVEAYEKEHDDVTIKIQLTPYKDYFTKLETSATGSRYAKFMGTMGEIIADMTANTIQITPFGKDTETIDINQIASDFFGHGGGDKRMVEDFIDMLLLGNGPSGHTTTVEQSVESHYCAFAAEESRLHNGAVVELDKFRK